MLKSKVKITGEISAKCYDQTTLSWHERLINKLVNKGILPKRFHRLGMLRWADTKYNVICNAGFEGVGQILTGVYADTGEVNYMALGTDDTAVAATDTQLGTEVYRNVTASGAVADNVTHLTAFFNEGETNGTYEEFGNFIDGAAGANTGLLWSHVLTGGWVKTNVDVLIVDCKYTFTSS